MEERKSGKKKSKVKKGTIAFIIVTSIVGLMIIVPVILLSIVSTLHENAAEQFNKSIYPLKYESYVEKYSKEFDVDKCLVYSIIKNESNFDPDAVSSVGAIGLMQLMPETFTWLQNYRTDFMPDKLMDSNKLYDPKVNIEYGVYLLRYLLEFYDGNTSLAVCAYNAGTGAVDNWLAEGTISSDNVLAENVPYPETSNYLEKVISSIDKYRQLYFPDYVYTFVYSGSHEKDKTDTDNNSGAELVSDNSEYVEYTENTDYTNNEYYQNDNIDDIDNNDYNDNNDNDQNIEYDYYGEYDNYYEE
ncbi:MAG: lytic transglycosylase domain-containing protein [Acutalibacteraceae bacterium]|nr:lytic transglycosylase domain-containing protein [Acutalibacteraceae bacterium]